jgi:rRNA maturation endonuclease Nob1
MEDIRILEECVYCGGHMALRESVKVDKGELYGTLWLVKLCPLCGGAGTKEVARLRQDEDK